MSNDYSMIVFVILHYLSFDETIKSVDLILQTFESYRISVVIVDNASPNDSGILLLKYYESTDKVHIVLSRENQGFAKGNNMGYEYALANMTPDFIVFLNNDVVITQSDFIDEVVRLYDLTSFAVLGPDIYVPSLGIHQNPKRLGRYSMDEVESLIVKYRQRQTESFFSRIRTMLKKSALLRSTVLKMRRLREGAPWNVERDGVILHGACFIVSRLFIDKRAYALNPRTFMYYEMEILREECERQQLRVYYSPSIRVEHHHSVSTRLAHKDPEDLSSFTTGCILESLTVLHELQASEGFGQSTYGKLIKD